MDTEQSSTALALSNHVADMGNPHGTTKAQVGLVNVDNTADVDKPVSTATQNALNLKANTADLGSAAFASTGAFATSAQGTKADSAVQPAALDGLNADRHTHANKAVLDGIDTSKLIPSGGAVGQVLMAGASGRVWGDVPGIVYPTIISPDGSVGPNGVITPTVVGSPNIVAGQYGQAWAFPDGTQYVSIPTALYWSALRGTIMVRFRLYSNTTNHHLVAFPGGGYYQGAQATSDVPRQVLPGISAIVGPTAIPVGTTKVLSTCRNGAFATVALDGAIVGTAAFSASITGTGDIFIGGVTSTVYASADIESVLFYPDALPNSEIARISNIAAAWTMANTAANMLVAPGFTPTNKTASGTTNMLADSLTITLAAGTLIQDTGARTTVSTVPHAQVTAVVGGGNVTGWIPVSQITAL
jgi:hypothetical protein